MDKRIGRFTHTDYRNAKIIHLVEKGDRERFVYKKMDISREEADRITELYYKEKGKKTFREEYEL